MTSEAMIRDRRNTVLAAVIGTVLAAGYASSASALEWEFENGGRLNWNTTISLGSSWRASDPNALLYTKGDGSLIGLTSGPRPPGTGIGPRDGTAGNQAAGIADLNYAKGDAFSQPVKLLSDVEYKNGNFGALVRIKAWYDYALENNKVRIGNQAGGFGFGRVLGPTSTCVPISAAGVANCLPTPLSAPGQNEWKKNKLSDSGFEDEQKFTNAMLLDAYAYGSFDIGDSNLQLRLGNQVVNWGESVFIQGVNQINPIDVPAARRAGAELKEILLPVWMAYGNWGFNFGSFEAFYQLKWNNTSVDGCDTYWAVTGGVVSADPGKCGSATVFNSVFGVATPGTTSPLVPQYGSAVYGQAAGFYVPLVKGKEASDSGQFGVAFRFPVDAIDTEFGLYFENIHNRTPITSGYASTNPNQLTAGQRGTLQAMGLVNAAGTAWTLGSSTFTSATMVHKYLAGLAGIEIEGGKSFWEYPEDLQIFGVSAATNLFGWSTSAEISYQKDVPVQVNGNDLLTSLLVGLGPNQADGLAAYAAGEGAYLKGYDRFDKWQYQVNTVKTFSNILNAENVLIVAEIGAQNVPDMPDYTKGGVRYGRGFMWGNGSSPALAAQNALTGGNTCSPTLVGAPVPIASPVYNPSPMGCRNKGYVTDFSWGYRVRASMDYNNVFNSGFTLTPSVFWSDDVEGVSADPTFNEGRQTLGLGLKATYNKKWAIEANYVSYANASPDGKDTYDPLFDRDYYSVAASVTF